MKFKFYKSKRKAHFNEERKINYLYYFGAKIATVISILFMNILIKTNKNPKNNNININIEKSSNNVTVEDKIKMIKIFTINNPFLYTKYENCLTDKRDELNCFYHLLLTKKVVGKERILLGDKNDGSYVLLNDFENIKYAYSFGIADRIQFDDDLAKRNIDVYMYDHTISQLPHNNEKFHWKKIGIAGNAEKNYQLKTLEDLIVENGHSNEYNMILKIDVEEAEWNSLNDLSEERIKQFKYIVIEYHFLKESNIKLYHDVLKKIYKTHQPFYHRCHGRENLIILENNIICKYLEVSYVIRDNYQFEKDDTIYPLYEWDSNLPQNDVTREINLNILKLFDF